MYGGVRTRKRDHHLGPTTQGGGPTNGKGGGGLRNHSQACLWERGGRAHTIDTFTRKEGGCPSWPRLEKEYAKTKRPGKTHRNNSKGNLLQFSNKMIFGEASKGAKE